MTVIRPFQSFAPPILAAAVQRVQSVVGYAKFPVSAPMRSLSNRNLQERNRRYGLEKRTSYLGPAEFLRSLREVPVNGSDQFFQGGRHRARAFDLLGHKLRELPLAVS